MKRIQKAYPATFAGSKSPNIGLIGDYEPTVVDGFFADVQRQDYPNAKFSFSRTEGVCRECLYGFIKKHSISTLFVDRGVTFEGGDITEPNDIVSFIGHICQCDIYFTSEVK